MALSIEIRNGYVYLVEAKTTKTSINLKNLLAYEFPEEWVNENGILQERFEWQKGYGAFSYSAWDKNKIFNYILNQEKHHEKQKFSKEYQILLDKHEVEYDENYLFDELI